MDLLWTDEANGPLSTQQSIAANCAPCPTGTISSNICLLFKGLTSVYSFSHTKSAPKWFDGYSFIGIGNVTSSTVHSGHCRPDKEHSWDKALRRNKESRKVPHKKLPSFLPQLLAITSTLSPPIDLSNPEPLSFLRVS